MSYIGHLAPPQDIETILTNSIKTEESSEGPGGAEACVRAHRPASSWDISQILQRQEKEMNIFHLFPLVYD